MKQLILPPEQNSIDPEISTTAWSLSKTDLVLKKQMTSNSFHTAMRLPLRISQVFGLFPLSMDATSAEFKWLHWRTLYAIITFLLFLQECLKVVYQDLQKSLNILTVDVMLFYLTAVTHSALLLRLSMEWPSYVEEWRGIEARSLGNGQPGGLKAILNTITLCVLTLATVEHYLGNGYSIKKCMDSSSSVSEGLEKYFRQTYSSGFILTGYTVWQGVLLEFINIQMTFLWNFVDIFIMLVGTALKLKVKQVSQRLKGQIRIKMTNKHAWRSIRRDYLLVMSLCRSTNEKISSLIVMSFLVNLYFVLKQIFKSLMVLEDSVERAYFYVSFALLVIRITCVIVFGSGMHEEWREMGSLIQNVPFSAYNEEVERLLINITTHELVLSGKNFFSIRRGLILQIAGTIVTYELVIIQFHTEMLRAKV